MVSIKNLEYARQLLLHLETEFATVKNSVQRKKVQEDLGRKKAVIRRLNERLHGVEQLETMWEDEEERTEKKKEKVEQEKEESETARIGLFGMVILNRYEMAKLTDMQNHYPLSEIVQDRLQNLLLLLLPCLQVHPSPLRPKLLQ